MVINNSHHHRTNEMDHESTTIAGINGSRCLINQHVAKVILLGFHTLGGPDGQSRALPLPISNERCPYIPYTLTHLGKSLELGQISHLCFMKDHFYSVMTD